MIQAVLDDPSDSNAALSTVERIRTAVHDLPGADAKVGGQSAIQLDTNVASEHDRTLIIPIVLVVIFLVLAVLLRALVAPLLLIATVVLSFAATMGVSALVFNHLLDFPGSDPAIPLFGFIFLVALGIDYNIFLMTRVREEAKRHGTRGGVLRRTGSSPGGSSASAGVVLAATFSALAVLPLVVLVELGVVVGRIGEVLLDTTVVRSLLGAGADARTSTCCIWWPSRLSTTEDPSPPPPEIAAVAGRNELATRASRDG